MDQLEIYPLEKERSYIMIKPDGVQRGMIGKVIEKFEKRGFKLIALKMRTPTKELLESHYEEHKGKSFFKAPVIKLEEKNISCLYLKIL